jgi:hypothetical protein
MLPKMKIASPCSVSRESMTGDNRARHCAECNLDVYNFTAMTSAEIEQLIQAKEGQRLCGRLYQRTDGTVLTENCPVGLRARIRNVSHRLTATLAAMLSLVLTAHAKSPQAQSQQPPQQQQHTPHYLMGIVAAPAVFNLVIIGPAGEPIANARVSLISPMAGRTVAQQTTDGFGRLRLSHISGGQYAAVVDAPGLIQQRISVSIHSNQRQDITLKLNTPAFTTGRISINPAPITPSK